MTRFDWNGLRRGDVVFVHRPSVTPRSAVRDTFKFLIVRGRRGNDVCTRARHGAQHVGGGDQPGHDEGQPAGAHEATAHPGHGRQADGEGH